MSMSSDEDVIDDCDSSLIQLIDSFLEAIAANNHSLVAAHLASGLDVNLASPLNPWSGAACAVAVDAAVDDAILAMILTAGADVSLADEQGNTPLHCAVMRGNERHVALLLSLGNASVANLNSARNSALHLAANCPDQRVLQICVEHDTDSQVRRLPGALQRTPLHIAATNANPAVALLLIGSGGCAVNAVDRHGQTPLHLAAIAGSADVVKALIDAGAQVDVLDSDQRSALHFAAECTDARLVQVLLAAGAKLECDRHGRTPLHRAALRSNELVMVALLGAAARQDAAALINQTCNEGRTPCHYAVSNSNEAVLAELLAAGCDVNRADSAGRTPCFMAAKNASERHLAMLVAAGCDAARANERGERPCHVAAANANEKAIGVLLAAGVDCDAASELLGSACHAAAANSNEKVLEALIARGANFRKRDAHGNEPVHVAAANPNERVTAALIAAGASFNVADEHGSTPLHTVAVHGFVNVGALLLRTDAVECLDRGDHYGRTPLHVAVRYESIKIIEMLICAGANPNEVDVDGWTAIAGLTMGKLSTLTLLVAGGADAGATRFADVSIDQAIWARNSDMIAMLLAAGGSLDVPNWNGVTARKRIADVWPTFGDADVAAACRAVAARQLCLIRARAADVVIGLQPLALDALQMCEVLLYACGPVAAAVPFHKLWAIAVAAKHFRRLSL